MSREDDLTVDQVHFLKDHYTVLDMGHSLTHLKTMKDLGFSRQWLGIMAFYGMRCQVGLLYTDVSEERAASIFRVEEKTRARKRLDSN
jgi:hypothetical protein